MKIDRVYTRGGDRGTTSLVGGERVDKDAARIEAYGTVDELNAALGAARAALAGSPAEAELDPLLARLQNELFHLGAELATPDEARRARGPRIEDRHVAALERDLDTLNAGLPALASFVLPGGGRASAALHVARTVCRRAERRAVTLARQQGASETALRYLNRLSDALFVFARHSARREGRAEALWEPEPRDPE